jgi:hypothetical protein
MLKDAKLILRLSSDAFNDEVQGLINAGKDDLTLAGVNVSENLNKPLIKRAILTYVKAHFGNENQSNRFIADYERQKLALRDSGDYRVGV